MSDFAIGIDLGTSTSEVVAYFKDGHMEPICDSDTKSPIIPSLISLNKKGKLLVGESARDFVDLPGHGVREVKRKMGTGERILLGEQEYSAEELSSLILSKLKYNAEVRLGESITDVVLSVPANFNDAAKQATLHAAEIAGLNVVYLINEPTAAAIAFGIKNIDLEAQIVVFDFGGGTLDVTTLEMMEGVLDVKSSYGDISLGGKDFDEAMMELVLNKFFEQNEIVSISDKATCALKATAEKAKISLSSQDSYEVHLEYFTKINGELVDLKVEITRSEFEDKVEPLLNRARECLKRALEGGKFKPSSIDKILLVGGTTYIPCVRNLVNEFFGKTVKSEVDPDMAVAVGASIKGGMEKGFVNTKNSKKSLVFTDVCPMGIGTEVLHISSCDEELYYSSLIKPNTLIPCNREYLFYLLSPVQDKVVFSIYQTHLPDESIPLEQGISSGLIEDIGVSGTINDIPPSDSDKPHPVKIFFDYDINGMVKLRAEIPGIERSMNIEFNHSKYRMDLEGIVEARMRIKELLENSDDLSIKIEDIEIDVPNEEKESIIPDWESHPRAKQYVPLFNRAEKIISEHPEHEVRLVETINGLKKALANDDKVSIDKFADDLTDLIFDIMD